MDEWVHIFASVVEHSSINKASRTLNISQPALSRKIMKIEDSLGVQLFDRKGKRLELTPAGRITYEYAQQLRQLQKKYYQELMRQTEFTNRSVTIGASLTTLQSTLPDLISFLMKQEPTLDFQTVTGKTHEIVSYVKDHKVDFGLVASHTEEPELICVPLFDDHLKLVVPRNHAIAEGSTLSIDSLNGLPMILFSKGTWYRILVDELFTEYGIVPEIKMEIDSFEAIIRLVSTCGFSTLLPSSYLREQALANNDLVAFDIEQLRKTVRTTSIVYHHNSELAAWIDSKMSAVKSFFAGKHY